MQVIVSPSSISGSVTAPASKSVMQRACAAALLKGGRTILKNPGISADDEAALDIIQQLGAIVERVENKIIINSNGIKPISNQLNCGESGLSIRMFTPIAALSHSAITITGSGSLIKRPLHFFDEIFPKLGVDIKSHNGLLPLQIKGPLVTNNISVDGSLSSQFLTGLLFAFSAANANDVTINVDSLNSKPYIDLTLEVMNSFGLKVPVHDEYKNFYFSSKNLNDNLEPGEFFVEGDWSGAAFLLVAGAIAGEVSLKGLNKNSVQADKAILVALEQAGAKLNVGEDFIQVYKSPLKAFHFNATNCPDIFPPLAVLAAYADGTSIIEGVHRLTHKESNRALTLQDELGKMGVEIKLDDDKMLITGSEQIKGSNVHSRHDHRIAMACAIAALGADGKVTIDDAQAVNKSYKNFWEELEKLQK